MLDTATAMYPNEGAIELRIRHVEGSPFDKRANYGVKIRYCVMPTDSPPPEDTGQMYESVSQDNGDRSFRRLYRRFLLF